jgi:hypothetical protein
MTTGSRQVQPSGEDPGRIELSREQPNLPLTPKPLEVLRDLRSVVRGEAKPYGVRYSNDFDLLTINIDRLPIIEWLPAQDESMQGSPRHILQTRVQMAAGLIRLYREQAKSDLGLPMPSMFAYCADGDFPMDMVPAIVDAGGTFWRYKPDMDRTLDEPPEPQQLETLRRNVGEFLSHLLGYRGTRQRQDLEDDRDPTYDALISSIAEIHVEPGEFAAGLESQPSAPYKYQTEPRPRRVMSPSELQQQKDLAPYRDNSFSLGPEELKKLIWGTDPSEDS